MRNGMKALLAAAAFVLDGIATAEAGDIAAMAAHTARFDAKSFATVYYTATPEGFDVVVTIQQGLTDTATVARFETVLAAGQSATVSIPRAVAKEPARILLKNAGDHLHIVEPNPAPSAW
jgi:hypothetical protein